MKEHRAVLLGFGLVAFAMVAVVVYLWFGVDWTLHPGNAHMDDPVSKAFQAAPGAANGPVTPAPAVEALLPLGTPATEAISKFTVADFKCERRPREATCKRIVAGASAGDEWMVFMTFDDADRLASRSATRHVTAL